MTVLISCPCERCLTGASVSRRRALRRGWNALAAGRRPRAPGTGGTSWMSRPTLDNATAPEARADTAVGPLAGPVDDGDVVRLLSERDGLWNGKSSTSSSFRAQ